MDEKKNPHNQLWTGAWILLLLVFQLISTFRFYKVQYQNEQNFQHLWDAVHQTNEFVKENLEQDTDFYQDMNQYIESLVRYVEFLDPDSL